MSDLRSELARLQAQATAEWQGDALYMGPFNLEMLDSSREPALYAYASFLAEHIDALLAEAHAAGVREGREQAAQWQPMETAPKDGTHVLIQEEIKTGVVSGKQTTRINTQVGAWLARGPAELGWGSPSGWYGNQWPMRPTHWMPLPAPPAPGATR